jgi:hypothetical protein
MNLRVLIFLNFSFCSVSCMKSVADVNWPNDSTANKLFVLGMYVERVVEEKKMDLRKCETIESILELLDQARCLEYGERESMQRDFWMQKLQVEWNHGAACSQMRISSSGANGVAESGGGDDLFVELIICGEQARGRVKRLSASGLVQFQELPVWSKN